MNQHATTIDIGDAPGFRNITVYLGDGSQMELGPRATEGLYQALKDLPESRDASVIPVVVGKNVRHLTLSKVQADLLLIKIERVLQMAWRHKPLDHQPGETRPVNLPR